MASSLFCNIFKRLPGNSVEMSTRFLEPEQKSFDTFQAWRSVREHHHQINKAASRLNSIKIKTQEFLEASSSQAHELSALEGLPEEILIAVMEYLDYESLYRLSQTTGYFLRLSFDSVFESDPSWRTFRHTIDGLSNGPRRRVLDRTKCQPRAPVLSQELLLPRHGPASAFEPKSCSKPVSVHHPSEENGITSDIEDEDEGETMLEFMTREPLPLDFEPELGRKSRPAQKPLKKYGAIFNIEDEDEGETMFDFMARGR
ncbi:hypothetical protein E0Z10_g10102 [Xylaria hypoxylon]|uniref:F-box domain-containing protein n=1 Tax=Xylaria hypoxylon TaxID=37992 RepID=A0A4Z0YFI6_9PEZI|nr:hypothetical protein E0Z10_g10102 [Xylaria hypoxylon]